MLTGSSVRSCTVLPISQLEALELPLGVKMDKLAEASRKYEYMNLYLTIMIKCRHDTTYPTRHPLSATFLTPNEIFQISNCQE